MVVPIPEAAAILRNAEGATGVPGATSVLGGVRAKLATHAVRQGAKGALSVPAGVPSVSALPRLGQVGAATAALPGGGAAATVRTKIPTEPAPGVQALPLDSLPSVLLTAGAKEAVPAPVALRRPP